MTHLYRTQTTGNRRTFTVSTWIKFSGSYGSSGAIILNTDGSNTNQNFMYQLTTSHTLRLHLYGGDVFTTTRKIRDYSSWYHLVLGIDTTQASAGDRVKLYVNGELQSITQESLYPAQNFDFGVGDNGRVMSIMGDHDNSNNYDNKSYLSHYHFCDGYQYQASDFGETDSTTGEWKIKTSPSVNYGSTGFFLKFENSSNLVEDSGGNSISFSTSGTPIASQDNPSNVFATWNPLVPTGGGYQGNSSTHRYGNNDFVTNNSSSNYGTTWSTLGMTTGKYYMEIHYESNSNQAMIGIIGHYPTSTANYIGGHAQSYAIYPNGNKYNSGSSSSYGTSWTNGDYLGIFLDLDNNKLYFSKNGTVMNSGTGIDITAASSTEMGAYHFGCMEYNSSGNGDFAANFGNGVFRTTALTGTTYDDADGIGIFKYDPTGVTLDGSSKSFKALCTKGLNN